MRYYSIYEEYRISKYPVFFNNQESFHVDFKHNSTRPKTPPEILDLNNVGSKPPFQTDKQPFIFGPKAYRELKSLMDGGIERECLLHFDEIILHLVVPKEISPYRITEDGYMDSIDWNIVHENRPESCHLFAIGETTSTYVTEVFKKVVEKHKFKGFGFSYEEEVK